MDFRLLALLIVGFASGALTTADEQKKAAENVSDENDLKTAASTLYSDRYPDWSRNYPGYRDYGVTGYGSLDDRYSYSGGYDGYGGYDGGYARGRNYDGYSSPDGWYKNGYDSGPRYGDGGYSSYGGGAGYGYNSYSGNNGYSYGGNGGYGGYAGNGGLNSYYGYNNPAYPGSYHLGYGYYNKRPGYGNIYNNGITPSLVTGYRGYSKK